MSLAQKTERASVTKLAVLPSPAGPSTLRPNTPIDFRQITRRPAAVTPLVTSTQAAPEAESIVPPPQEASAAERPVSKVALDLLAEVSNALPILMSRCQSAENALDSVKEQARADLNAAKQVCREWEQIAQSLKIKVEQLERDNTLLKQRVDAAEHERTSIRVQAERSERAAAEAECLSSLFQDKVIAAFGAGTPGHSILESVRGRTPLQA